MKRRMLMVLCMATWGVANAGDRLLAPELKALYTDATLIGDHRKLGAVRTYYGPDGKVESLSEGGIKRSGKWWIDESSDKRCVRWSHKNKKFCRYTEKNADGTYSMIHPRKGKVVLAITRVVPGNHLSDIGTTGSGGSTGDSLKSRLSNATAKILVNDDPVFKQYAEWRFKANGELKMVGENEKRNTRWWTKGNEKLCVELKKGDRCFTAEVEGNNIKLLKKNGALWRTLLNVRPM